MIGSGKSGLSQNNFTRFFMPINILLLNCQVARAILTFHHICDYCDKFSFRLDQFEELSKWLGEQQSNHGLKVMTIAEVVGGDVQPVVLP